MKELLKKYSVINIPYAYVDLFVKVCKKMKTLETVTETDKEFIYKHFKANISCVGLEPEEYETVINWFCDTMEY